MFQPIDIVHVDEIPVHSLNVTYKINTFHKIEVSLIYSAWLGIEQLNGFRNVCSSMIHLIIGTGALADPFNFCPNTIHPAIAMLL